MGEALILFGSLGASLVIGLAIQLYRDRKALKLRRKANQMSAWKKYFLDDEII